MKSNIVNNFLGKVLIGIALLFIFPIIVAVANGEPIMPFMVPLCISLMIGLVLNLYEIKQSDNLYAKDGLKIVAVSWVILSIIGAFPMYLNRDASFIDAIVETVSGFTTTGISVFKDVESLNSSILFWRSFTNFVGGMGVLALVMVIIPLSKNDKSMHVLKAEMPGPSVSKLVPSMKKTLIYLYGIYIGLTFVEFILLLFGGNNAFNSMLLSFATASTGGFSPFNDSCESLNIFSKYVISVFMILFGVNFNIYFLILMKDIKSALKSEELRWYIAIAVIAIVVVFGNTLSIIGNVEEAMVDSVFQVSSFITSTGFGVGNVNIYSAGLKVLAFVLMAVCACAGSTCGGMKLSRVIISLKSVRRDLIKLIHPNSVETIKFEGKKISDDTINTTNTFVILFILLIIISLFIVGLDKFDLETTFNAVMTTFTNNGLFFGDISFTEFTTLSKITMCIGMLCGRLEIFPFVTLLAEKKK